MPPMSPGFALEVTSLGKVPHSLPSTAAPRAPVPNHRQLLRHLFSNTPLQYVWLCTTATTNQPPPRRFFFPSTPRYALINTAPLLARPGATSERWHVLSNPHDPAAVPADAVAATSPSSPPSPSAGTILLSMGFTPTGAGTPSMRPLSATVPGSAGRAPRHFSADSPAASGSGNASGTGSGGGGGGSAGGGEGGGARRTPRRETQPPAIPEGFSLGTAAMPHGGSGGDGDGDGDGGRAMGRAEPLAAAKHAGDRRRPTTALQRESSGGGDGDITPGRASGAKGGGGGAEEGKVLLPEVPGLDGVGNSAGAVETGSTGSGQRERLQEEEVAVLQEEQEEADDEGMVHLFRVKSYPAPVWCEICDGLLLGVSQWPREWRRWWWWRWGRRARVR